MHTNHYADLREVFFKDLARFADDTEYHLQSSVEVGLPSQGARNEIERHAHSLKGIASTMQANALSAWGDDLERLFNTARDAELARPAQAAIIYQFVLSSLPRWRELNHLSVNQSFEEANALYTCLKSDVQSLERQQGKETQTKAEACPRGGAPRIKPPSGFKQKPTTDCSSAPPSVEIREEVAEEGANPQVVDAAEVQIKIDPNLVAFFREDAEDQVTELERFTLALERNENSSDQVHGILRVFHTLKGAANSIGLSALGKNLHMAEEALSQLSEGAGHPPAELFKFLFQAIDQIRGYALDLKSNPNAVWPHNWKPQVSRLLSSNPAETKAPPQPQADPEPSAPTSLADDLPSQRPVADKLSKVLNLLGETVLNRNRLDERLLNLDRLLESLRRRSNEISVLVSSFLQDFDSRRIGASQNLYAKLSASAPVGDFSELEFDRYDEFSTLARSVAEMSNDLSEILSQSAKNFGEIEHDKLSFHTVARELRDEVAGLGLMPISSLFPRLQRAFRDALHAEQKEAELVLSGEDVQLDRSVINRLYGPLLHLIRNSIVHGIERSATRQSAGKNAMGRVSVVSVQRARQIEICLEDDGAGLDFDAILQKAMEKGLWPTTGANRPSDEQLEEWLFTPGFSTKKQITQLAGRGIGLDVVRRDVEGMNGFVKVQHEKGKGTRWILEIPIATAITEVLFVRCATKVFALPLNFVISAQILEHQRFVTTEAGTSYVAESESHPVIVPPALLNLPSQESSPFGVLVEVAGKKALLRVDEIQGRREVVLKPLDAVLARHRYINGATLDNDGRVIFVLNLASLLKKHFENRLPSVEQQSDLSSAVDTGEFRVLIVDDSLSVRKVQELYLTNLGCSIVAAVDGLDALEKLRTTRFDFVLTDLEMPRLNGYDLISEIRGHVAWTQLPIVVISSRGSDKHVTKAMRLGADSFLSKPFTEGHLDAVFRRFSKKYKR